MLVTVPIALPTTAQWEEGAESKTVKRVGAILELHALMHNGKNVETT